MSSVSSRTWPPGDYGPDLTIETCLLDGVTDPKILLHLPQILKEMIPVIPNRDVVLVLCMKRSDTSTLSRSVLFYPDVVSRWQVVEDVLFSCTCTVVRVKVQIYEYSLDDEDVFKVVKGPTRYDVAKLLPRWHAYEPIRSSVKDYWW